ncbi:MAG TPA: hypothetical protein VFN88_13120, partial [Caulobacteraceae bacterium]|nr:hypothetical protein [Caulobacteraceae bacterium]
MSLDRRTLLAGSAFAASMMDWDGPARAADQKTAAARRVLGFDDGWRFFRGDAPSAEGFEFEDRSWAEVQLPHDWSI